MTQSKITVGLVGNPNAGKSTLFNGLTGANQHVGNWPGKTVEKKVGTFFYRDTEIEIIDLPGTYSLSAFSIEEVIARDYLLVEKPDVVIAVVDATNLERNLYVTVQALELEIPMVIALNMMDVATQQGYEIDTDKLALKLGSPVVTTVARLNSGLDELSQAVIEKAAEGKTDFKIDYGKEIESAINRVQEIVQKYSEVTKTFTPRWLSVRLLEKEENALCNLGGIESGLDLLENIDPLLTEIQSNSEEELDCVFADFRYTWINSLVQEVLTQPESANYTISDRIDRVITNRYLGLPIFLLMMWILFKLTTDIAAPMVDWVTFVIEGPLTVWINALLEMVSLQGTWFSSLMLDGIVAGVGGVLVFVPVIAALFFCLALLEDSGYMARAAFIMDRFMQPLGLQGKSFLPMLVGFGCNVPAIYATRTLGRRRDRIITGLLIPFMSCGARLPVYILFAQIFFPEHKGTVVFSMYLLGILIAVVVGLILNWIVFPTKEVSNLVIELPQYHWPTTRNVWFYVKERTGSFIRNASTLILGASVIIWLLMSIPVSGDAKFAKVDLENSAYAAISGLAAPALKPLGFGSWESSGALISGFVAKEVVISTTAQIYGLDNGENLTAKTSFGEDLIYIGGSFLEAVGDTLKSIPLIIGIDLFGGEDGGESAGLMARIKDNFEVTSNGHPKLAALAFMVFVLAYTPCVVVVSVQKQEYGARWMWFSLVGQLVIAWLLALLVFQGGMLLGIG